MSGHGRLLCIDHGIKRLGLAICDESRLVARELMVINRASKKEDFERLQAIITQEGVSAVLVGLPVDFSKPEGEHTQADTVRLWAERFAEVIDLPLTFWDEQDSSEEAKELPQARKRKLTDPIDDLAARVILQRYLDALRDGLVTDPL